MNRCATRFSALRRYRLFVAAALRAPARNALLKASFVVEKAPGKSQSSKAVSARQTFLKSVAVVFCSYGRNASVFNVLKKQRVFFRYVSAQWQSGAVMYALLKSPNVTPVGYRSWFS